MLRRILHWIYCLPLSEATLLILCATGAFFWMRHRWEQRRWWKGGVIALLLCWAVVVLVQTVVIGRTQGRAVSLLPFHSYIVVLQGGEKELIRSDFMNVILFYPGGLLVHGLCRRRKMRPIVLFLLLSVGIELCQYVFHMGTVETDDVIHNTLGAFLGMLASRQYEKHQRRSYEEKSGIL